MKAIDLIEEYERKVRRTRAFFTFRWREILNNTTPPNFDYEDGQGLCHRIKAYNVPAPLAKRFSLFTELMSIGYFYQPSYSEEVGVVDTNFFSIKCKAFGQYVEECELETFNDLRAFIEFQNILIDYVPESLTNWQKSPQEIYDENIEVERVVNSITTKYIRNRKINKVKC